MPAGINYVEYFYPGVIVLVLLFTAIFATISTVEDRKQGFLQGVLVAPISRATIVMGQALGCTTLALVQGIIFLAMAPLAGIHLSLGAVAVSIVMMALIAFAMTSIGLAIAWRIESTQGFHAIMNMMLMPIWLLSGAFFPAAGAPGWLRWTMRLNPLTYAVDALQAGTVSCGAGVERRDDADGLVGGDRDRVRRLRIHPGNPRRPDRLDIISAAASSARRRGGSSRR